MKKEINEKLLNDDNSFDVEKIKTIINELDLLIQENETIEIKKTDYIENLIAQEKILHDIKEKYEKNKNMLIELAKKITNDQLNNVSEESRKQLLTDMKNLKLELEQNKEIYNEKIKKYNSDTILHDNYIDSIDKNKAKISKETETLTNVYKYCDLNVKDVTCNRDTYEQDIEIFYNEGYVDTDDEIIELKHKLALANEYSTIMDLIEKSKLISIKNIKQESKENAKQESKENAKQESKENTSEKKSKYDFSNYTMDGNRLDNIEKYGVSFNAKGKKLTEEQKEMMNNLKQKMIAEGKIKENNVKETPLKILNKITKIALATACMIESLNSKIQEKYCCQKLDVEMVK